MNDTRYSKLIRSQLGFAKRPRGLDPLLGHLLDKRISVRCKLTGSSTNKIAENLSQK